MNLKRKILLTVGITALVVVVGVPAALLFRGISQFSDAAQSLAMSVRELRSLHDKNPFPSRENVKLEHANVATQEHWFKVVIAALREGQVDRQASTPSRFMTQFNEVRNRLFALAGDRVPENFNLGFGRYAEGMLPTPDHVSRLTQQLKIIEQLVTLLLDSKVKSIVSISREEFDADAESGREGPGVRRGRRRPLPRRGGASRPQSGANKAPAQSKSVDLYSKWHFSVELQAKENAVHDILNRLVEHRMFIVVTGVELKKQESGVRMPETGGIAETAAEPAAEPAANGHDDRSETRQERMVSGPALDVPLAVRMELDVYTFPQ